MKKISLGLFTLTLTTAAFANTPLPDVAPATEGQHVFINIPQQRLFLYTDGELTKAYPVAVGKAITQTNLGEHKIGVKAFNPTWHIPKSIQKERGDNVKTIPPGPKNPLGPVFVRFGDPKLGLGIHGTNVPSSVPGVRSHGCVRMKSPDALEFANTIATGSPAYVIYQMAALNEDANKNLWLAAYRDPYNKKNLDTAALEKSITAWAKAHGKSINTRRVNAILKNRTGQANCLTCTKGVKLKGPLKSLAWTTGSSAYSKPKAMSKPVPVKDDVLPSGSEIEIDAGDDTAKPITPTPVTPQTTQSVVPTNAAASAASVPAPASSYVPVPAYPTQEIPADTEPTELLF
ncbi:L,D-transpeptidase [Neisseria iguanae]|uniref:L,D-transpeptidase n=1 Tax=Neisseria iguanae TaxID=90242 RepID=A0A2P7U2J5_9NEIS|nr:L,D-transpeptidase [Neisseria iguanae]PSJ81177.1 L,D-transpeptidase [Neisseria iguanae]